jgi:hypothetical protein
LRSSNVFSTSASCMQKRDFSGCSARLISIPILGLMKKSDPLDHSKVARENPTSPKLKAVSANCRVVKGEALYLSRNFGIET